MPGFSTTALPNRNSRGLGLAHQRQVGLGAFKIADSADCALNSQLYMMKLPRGAAITGGRVHGDPLDSSGSGSALASLHVGVVGATVTGYDGTIYGTTSTTAILVSSLAIGPDAVAVTGIKATNQRNWPFGGLILTNGPMVVNDECYVVATWTASALALTTGWLRIEVEYFSAQDS